MTLLTPDADLNMDPDFDLADPDIIFLAVYKQKFIRLQSERVERFNS